ncbi:MAG: thioesterase family protein [Spirochaetaceae bacterium]|nr:MAG: thioesterase family protein [Spirochaetaceae bacterium]
MARVRFEPQGREVFKTSLRVRVDDINYGGHLGNDAVLTLCHEARVRFLEEIGQSEMNLYGTAIIMTDAMVIYRAEGNMGDPLEVTLYLDDIDKHGFDLYYLLACGEREIARVKTGLAFYDYTLHRIVACPQGFLDKYG